MSLKGSEKSLKIVTKALSWQHWTDVTVNTSRGRHVVFGLVLLC